MVEALNEIGRLWWSWIGESTLQASLLMGLALLIDRVWRRRMWPEIRLALFVLVLLKLVLPPSLSSPVSLTRPLAETARLLPGRVQELWSPSSAAMSAIPARPPARLDPASSTPGEPPATSPSGAIPPVSAPEAATPSTSIPTAHSAVPGAAGASVPSPAVIAAAVWVLVAGALLGFVAARRRRLRRLLAGSPDAPESVRRQLEEVCRSLGVRPPPRPAFCDRFASPAVAGLLRPVILLPSGWCGELSRTELKGVLLHEAAHVKRRDLWLHEAALLLQIVFWFNPLVYLVRRRLRTLTELCCDRTVARHLEGRVEAYRRAILLVYRRSFVESEPAPAGIGLVEGRSRLGERLRWLDRSADRRSVRVRAGVLVACGLLTISVLPMAPSAISTTEEEGPSAFTIVSLRHFLPAGSRSALFTAGVAEFRRADGERRAFVVLPSAEGTIEVAAASAERRRDPESECRWVRSSPDFFGEGEAPVAGFRTLGTAANGPGFVTETYYAPALGCLPVLSVTLDRAGIRLTGAVEVIPGEPPPEAFEPRIEGTARERLEAFLAGQFLPWGMMDETEWERQKARAAAALTGRLRDGVPLTYDPVPGPGPTHGRIAPGGSLYLAGRVPNQIHRFGPTGAVEESLPIPVGDVLRERELAVDGRGRLYALLPDSTASGPTRSWDRVRRFDGAGDWRDVPLLPPVEGLIDFQVDGDGGCYFLAEPDREASILVYSAEGDLRASLPFSRVKPHPGWEGPTRNPPVGLARLAVSEAGVVHLLYPRHALVRGGGALDGDLLRVDPAEGTAERLVLERPTSSSALTEISSAGSSLILVWSDFEGEVGSEVAPFFSYHTSPKRLEVLEGGAVRPLGTVVGRVVDATLEGALVELPDLSDERNRFVEGTFLSFVPLRRPPAEVAQSRAVERVESVEAEEDRDLPRPRSEVAQIPVEVRQVGDASALELTEGFVSRLDLHPPVRRIGRNPSPPVIVGAFAFRNVSSRPIAGAALRCRFVGEGGREETSVCLPDNQLMREGETTTPGGVWVWEAQRPNAVVLGTPEALEVEVVAVEFADDVPGGGRSAAIGGPPN